jgi:hypothetical protein
VAPEDVITPSDISEFQTTGGRIVKTLVVHRDPWVVGSVARLRWQVDPEGAAAERGALEARASVLRRRLSRASPLAGLDQAALEARDEALAAEIAGLEARRGIGAAAGAQAALGQVRAVADAAAGAGAGEAERAARELVVRALALGQGAIEPQALEPLEHDARRLELLMALDDIAAVSPELRLRAEDLRRRVLALRPGDTSAAVVARALAERRAERGRVLDELTLRRSGVVPPQASLLARERRALEDELAATTARLEELGAPPRERAAADAARDPKASFAALVVRCMPCHRPEAGTFGAPPAVETVFTRAAFAHGPHLGQAACATCHAGVELAEGSEASHLPAIVRCRECHAPGRVLSSCQQCHRYHPGGAR